MEHTVLMFKYFIPTHFFFDTVRHLYCVVWWARSAQRQKFPMSMQPWASQVCYLVTPEHRILTMLKSFLGAWLEPVAWRRGPTMHVIPSCCSKLLCFSFFNLAFLFWSSQELCQVVCSVAIVKYCFFSPRIILCERSLVVLDLCLHRSFNTPPEDTLKIPPKIY